MKARLALAGVGAVALVACGGDSVDEPASAETVPAATEAIAFVHVGETEIGAVLVGPDGNTLYGFSLDSAARSNCDGACAETWPPLVVGEEWTVGPDVDPALFATMPRSDGTVQLVAGDWPLYAFSGDLAPGDVNGHGSGEVWFAVGADGELLRDATGGGSPGYYG